MELRHLKYFLTVAEELNFTKASEKLFISQPPLSRQIGELEAELKTKLFTRTNKKVELTEAGKYFESEVRKIFQKLDKVTLLTRKIGENLNGQFRIAYISSTYSENISRLINYLSSQFPFVHFKLFEVSTIKQIAALELGKIDLGILRAPVTSPDISTRLWFKDSFSIVYKRDVVQLKSEKEIQKLKDQTFVFFNKDYAPHYYEKLLEICAFYGFEPKVVHEANNVGSIVQLVKNGLGVSIVPTNVARNYSESEIEFMELKEIALFTDVLLAMPRGEDSEITSSAVRFLLDFPPGKI